MVVRTARPSRTAIMRSLSGLRADQGITAGMLAPMGITITFSPTVGLSAARIDKLGMDIRSFREPLKRAVQQVIAPSFRKNFDEGGRPDAWEPLSASTLEIRQRQGFSGVQPLIKTGLLRRTMGQLNIWTITRTSAMIKDLPEKIWYGAIHQAGSDTGSFGKLAARIGFEQALARVTSGDAVKTAPIPARPFALLQDDDIDAIDRVFWEWFEERVNRTWPVATNLAGRL
jgi:phage gpG-like protein